MERPKDSPSIDKEQHYLSMLPAIRESLNLVWSCSRMRKFRSGYTGIIQSRDRKKRTTSTTLPGAGVAIGFLPFSATACLQPGCDWW